MVYFNLETRQFSTDKDKALEVLERIGGTVGLRRNTEDENKLAEERLTNNKTSQASVKALKSIDKNVSKNLLNRTHLRSKKKRLTNTVANVAAAGNYIAGRDAATVNATTANAAGLARATRQLVKDAKGRKKYILFGPKVKRIRPDKVLSEYSKGALAGNKISNEYNKL